MASRRAIVTGSSGALGSALVRRLRAEGWSVTGVDVRAPAVGFEANQTILCDIGKADWEGLVSSCDVVFHLAAFVHRVPKDASESRELREVNVAAVARLARACRKAGTRLVFASTVAVFGSTQGVVTEARDPHPETEYAIAKLDAERAIADEGTRSLKYAVLRLPLIFGPRGRGNVEKMLTAIRAGRYWPIGPRYVPKSCLFTADAANALVLAAGGLVDGEVLIAAPSRPSTLGEIHAAAYRVCARVLPPHLPRGVALLTARVVDAGAMLLGKRVGLARQVATLTAPAHYDGSRFAAITGFLPQVLLEEGLRSTLEALEGGERP